MADGPRFDLSEEANKVGMGFGLICGFLGFAVNEWPGAIAGAIAGYAAGRLFVFIAHTLEEFIKRGLILLVLVLLFAGNIQRLIGAFSRGGEAAPPIAAPTFQPAPEPTVSPVPDIAPRPDPTLTPAAAPVPSSAPTAAAGMPIWIYNTCRHDVSLYLRWHRPGRGRVINGPWMLRGGEMSFLRYESGERVRAASPDIYFYGFTPLADARWTGDEIEPWNGQRLPMRKATVSVDPGGSYEFTLECADS